MTQPPRDLCAVAVLQRHRKSELIHAGEGSSHGSETDLYAGHDPAGHARQLPGHRAHAALELHHVRHGLTQAVRAAGCR